MEGGRSRDRIQSQRLVAQAFSCRLRLQLGRALHAPAELLPD